MAARISVGAALLSALAFYIPFAPVILTALYYIQVFCCVFLIGVAMAIEVNLLTEKSEIKNVIVHLMLSGCLIAFLQNEIATVSFDVFQIFTVAALVFLLLFFCKLPYKSWSRYVNKSDGIVKPITFMAGLFLLIGLSAIMALFGSVVAESIVHGISVYYISLAVCGVILAVFLETGHSAAEIPFRFDSVRRVGFYRGYCIVIFPGLFTCRLRPAWRGISRLFFEWLLRTRNVKTLSVKVYHACFNSDCAY